MDFGLSDEQRESRPSAGDSREVIRPVAAEHDAEESTPWEVLKAAREWGLNGIDFLQRLGRRPRRSAQRHLRGGAPLGLCRHRLGHIGLEARRGRHGGLRDARADRPLGP